MKEFLEVYGRHHLRLGFNLEIYHSSITDWCITVGYKLTNPKHGEEIVKIQESDYEYALAKAQIALKDWLLENDGGY